MTPFLKQVAQIYVEREAAALPDICFVFPNKRSGTFFVRYLTEAMGAATFVMPDIATIGEFTARFCPRVEASRLDQLFILYNEYSKLNGELTDFDQFMFWGEMLLSDFNDVDRDLADAEKLFINLRRYREVSADYLTPQQKEILSRYWGEEFVTQSPDRFWMHLHDESTPVEAKFLKLWEVLAPLYRGFHAALEAEGLATSGIYARCAVERLQREGARILRHKRYVFVGFNVLTLSEIRIFDILHTLGVADFYWDMGSPLLTEPGNRAGRFMRRNAKCFPSRHELPAEEFTVPRIRVTGIPSATGQTVMAASQLQEWADEKVVTPGKDALNTAVVLPDEGIFMPMIHAIPEDFSDLNVTMGFPMKATSFASFISCLVNMHLRARSSRDEWSYYYEDVNALLTHPVTQRLAPEGCGKLSRIIVQKRLYMVPAATVEAEAPDLAFLMRAIADTNNVEQVYDYFKGVLTTLEACFTPECAPLADDKKEADGGGIEEKHQGPLELFFIHAYREALDELITAVKRHGVEMRDITFIQLLQRAIATQSIAFTGEPLSGLQVMGVLETRALDFDNIVMLSMNERIFPVKHSKRSFIPDNLRRSYGLSTTDHQESIFAYYFYRLISRASNVRLLYDARTVGGKNSEMSRYISQLLYLFPNCEVTHDVASFDVNPARECSISIAKDEEIMRSLDEFRAGGSRSLSASSINTYINCPLSFYLKYICGLNLDEDVMDYMDASTYGQILHDVAECIYTGFKGEASEVKVTAQMLQNLLDSPTRLPRLITERVNVRFNRLPDPRIDVETGQKRVMVEIPDDAPVLAELTGEARVLGDVMLHFVRSMLRAEIEITPFDFIGAEVPLTGTFEVEPGLEINIKQIIDRVDRVYKRAGSELSSTLRIVDYKTGGDKLSFSDMAQLFNPNANERRKAVLQLMFYCNAYARKYGHEEAIQPVIYSMKTIPTEGIKPLSYDKKALADYRAINDIFLPAFAEAVKGIFDPATPFTQAENEHACKFCSFKPICHRQ